MTQRKLTALRIGNFKAFADTQRIPLKPITLIFGPNSAGKSSFIHSLALAHEAQFGRDKRGTARLDVHRTDIGGNSIDLGGFRQFVHRGQAGNRVTWGAELEVAGLGNRLRELLDGVRQISVEIIIGIQLDDRGYAKQGADPRVDTIKVAADGEELLHMSWRQSTQQEPLLRVDRLGDGHRVFRHIVGAIVESFTTAQHARDGDFAAAAEAIKSLLPELRARIGRFFPEGVELPQQDGDGALPRNLLMPISKGNRSEDIAQAVRTFLPGVLNEIVGGISRALSVELKNLQYLGPLRSFPPRHLAFAEHEDANWFAGGGYAWDMVRRDDAVRAAVNSWLGSDKLKTPYELTLRNLIAVERVQELLKGASEAQSVHLDFDDVRLLLLGPPDSAFLLAEKKGVKHAAIVERLKRIADEYKPKLKEASDGRAQMLLYSEVLGEWNVGRRNDDSQLDQSEESESRETEASQDADDLHFPSDELVPDLLLRDKRSDTLVSHRDVGIGISQVLPVLVAAYGSRGKLLAMEQPEIHLHPALQAELGDVFIESALGERQNTFILETHSEHLVLRLLRRIREGKIRSDEIAVLYVEPLARGSHFMELRIDNEGDFIDEWPGGFFEEAFHEKFAGR